MIDISKWTFVDLHIHSHFAAACSKFITIQELEKQAKLKGINVIGTGDCLHPKWMEEIKSELHYNESIQLLEGTNGVQFMLTAEVSNEYYDNGKFKSIHNLLFFDSFDIVEAFRKEIDQFGDLTSDGRPKLNLSCKSLARIISEKFGGHMNIIPAHIWTPWNGVFATNTGYDSVDQAFGEYSIIVTALETGLSSDPLMNALVYMTKPYIMASFSDPHTANKMGREATIIRNMQNVRYDSIMEALTVKDLYSVSTIEVPPAFGKYHWAGHRKCKTFAEKAEKCSVCGNMMTKGVDERVWELRQGTDTYKPQWQYTLVPLDDLLTGVGFKPKKRQEMIAALMKWFKTEFNIMLAVEEEELRPVCGPFAARAIIMNREGRINIDPPGFDGQFGKILFTEKPPQDIKEKPKLQSKTIKSSDEGTMVPSMESFF
jgi:uncharacterized protein (TIGR00375 family)